MSRAAFYGDLPTLRQLRANGASVDKRDDFEGYTPLGAATCNNQLRAVRLLLKWGVRVDGTSRPDDGSGFETVKPITSIMIAANNCAHAASARLMRRRRRVQGTRARVARLALYGGADGDSEDDSEDGGSFERAARAEGKIGSSDCSTLLGRRATPGQRGSSSRRQMHQRCEVAGPRCASSFKHDRLPSSGKERRSRRFAPRAAKAESRIFGTLRLGTGPRVPLFLGVERVEICNVRQNRPSTGSGSAESQSTWSAGASKFLGARGLRRPRRCCCSRHALVSVLLLPAPPSRAAIAHARQAARDHYGSMLSIDRQALRLGTISRPSRFVKIAERTHAHTRPRKNPSLRPRPRPHTPDTRVAPDLTRVSSSRSSTWSTTTIMQLSLTRASLAAALAWHGPCCCCFTRLRALRRCFRGRRRPHCLLLVPPRNHPRRWTRRRLLHCSLRRLLRTRSRFSRRWA